MTLEVPRIVALGRVAARSAAHERAGVGAARRARSRRVLVGVLVLGAVARGVAREAAAQRAVDLAALAGARAMHETNPRLFEPVTIDGAAQPAASDA